jgi:hypothetical protein
VARLRLPPHPPPTRKPYVQKSPLVNIDER